MNMKNNILLILLVIVSVALFTTGCSRPLHDAVDRGKQSKFDAALISGADINEVNIYGDTPLHRAAYKNRPLMAYTLAQKGANVYALDAKGCTPIEVASQAGNKEVAAILDVYMAGNKVDSIDGVWRKKHILVELDANSDGSVDESEYIIWKLPRLHKRFTSLDADHNGTLNANELAPLDK